jgi:phosphate/phosphite/phosphonate ABC transporter binding protein
VLPTRTRNDDRRALDPKAEVLVFGYAAQGASTLIRARVAQFSEALGLLAKAELAVYEAESYEDLAQAVVRGEVDLAWLPPLAFVALERKRRVVALVSAQRGGDTAFHSAVIVPRASALLEPEELAGKRAAWVDRYSASGYVVPRVGLAALGVDPRVAFAEQRFYHSHEAVVRAVVAGRADFGATYVGLSASGEITRGPWLEVEGADEAIRVLVRFGAIPGDVIAARVELPAPTRETLTRALRALSDDAGQRPLLAGAFGIDELRAFRSDGYDALRRLAEQASSRGLLQGDEDPDDDDDDEEPDELAEGELSTDDLEDDDTTEADGAPSVRNT